MSLNNNSQHGPIFVVSGLSRCGTTLLRLMLTAHSRISIPPESTFIHRLLQNNLDERTIINDSNRQCFLDIVWDEKDLKLPEWRLDRNEIDKKLRAMGEIPLADAIAEVYWAYAKKCHPDADVWGDKNPAYLWDMDAIRKIFPDARFVVIVRDIRDVYLSMFKVNSSNCWNIRNITNVWNEVIDLIENSVADDHVAFLKYEELLTNPETELQKVCDFLNLEFEASMLQYHTMNKQKELVPHSRVEWGHQNTLSPVMKNNFNKWARELAPERIELIECFSTKQLERMGYQKQFQGRRLSTNALILLMNNFSRLAWMRLTGKNVR
ncbi:sulfotransferase [Mariprofundus sp. KV]|uniref:sulfotransferase n=1 Tax=Mariprofundus sp. KV TaxID=2608715 RepID=UPI0015A4A187